MSDNLAVIQSAQTVSELQAIRKEVIATIVDFKELVKVTDQLNNGFRSGSTREIAAALKNGTGVAKAYNDENEKSVNINKKIITVEEEVNRVRKAGNGTLSETERLTQRIAQAKTTEGKSVAALKVELQQLNKENKQQAELQVKEEARLNAAISLYNKVEFKLNTLRTRYNELAIRKQLGLKLSDNEEKSLNNLTKKIEKYDTVLKNVDASAGKYQRNVGNYKSGFNALGNSINQLTREMPAFSVSMNTGFLAISNNLPILFDAISQVRAQNKKLKAEGKETQSLFKQLTMAIVSWQTAMSVGITILTVYGKDIFEYLTKLISIKKALNEVTAAQEAYNKVVENGDYRKVVEDVSAMTKNVSLAKQGFLDKKRVLKEYNETLGTVMGTATNFNQMEDILVKKTPAYLEAMKLRSAATYLLNQSAEDTAKATLLKYQSDDKFFGVFDKARNWVSNLKITSEEDRKTMQATLKKNANEARKEQEKTLNESMAVNRKAYDDIMGQFATLGKKAGLNLTNLIFGVDKDKDKKYTGSKLTGEQKDALDTLIANRDNALATLKKQRLDNLIDEEKYWKDYEKIYNKYSDGVQDLLKGYNAKANRVSAEAYKRGIEELAKSRTEIFNVEKRNYDARFKLAEQDLQNRIKLDTDNPYLNEVGRISAQNNTYQKLIDLNNDYYKQLIDSAIKNGQEVISIEAERDAKINDLLNQRIQNSNKLPEALKKDADYLNEIAKVTADISFEDQKRLIINSKKLTEDQKSFALSQLEKQNVIDINNLEVERLKTQRNQLIAQMAIAELYGNFVNPKDLDTLEKLNGDISKLENANIQGKIDIDKAGISEMLKQAAPAIDSIKSSLSELGLPNLANQFEDTFAKIKKGAFSWKDAMLLAATTIGDALTSLADRQKQIQISALDEQLKRSQANTELELSLIQSRLDAINNEGVVTQEQYAQRAALEDEARVIKEQQLEREKMIAMEKAKAEQRADSQKALINGAVGATQTIAQMGWVAGWPFALASLAFGVLQSGLIMARNPVPQYYVGTENAKAGLAWTQERGREVITDKNGNIKSFGSDNGPQLTMMETGDKVLNADRTKKFLSEFYDSPIGTDDIYQRAMKKQMLAPIMNFNNKVDAKEIGNEVTKGVERVMAKYSTASVYEVDGIVYKERPGKYPEAVGKAKKQSINVKISKNGRD
ncbi:hypothetical protein M2T79_12400 [Elizabethkingia miricola]|uniref:hypothetical protein n=1 Tax=Elizabethkingia miricola TaxID=172045 RepID=UPI0020196273|nr:hypothetical protein [Elizabethkingia miricola]MCL1657397.1 hypothetical protein [Elizabethkingia miricola]